MDFQTAIEIEACWKSRELLDVACRLVEAGLDCLGRGVDYFGPDDIPDNYTAGGTGLTGSAVHMLRSAGVIADYYGHHPEDGVMHGRRRSKRASANGRKIALYQIAGRGLADEFLRRHGVVMQPTQRELKL